MGYLKYTVEDFALDPHFRRWILHPDKETDLFWEEWLVNYPEKAHLLREGRELVLQLKHQNESMDDLEIDMLWNSIDQQISSDGSDEVKPKEKMIYMYPRFGLDEETVWDYEKVGKLAASILIIFCIGFSFYLAKKEDVIQPIVMKHENSWGKRSTIFLGDGTEVILNAGSSIEYIKGFSENERRVNLTGEAFFKVATNTTKPFKVVSGGIVTEALGTSFNIKAYEPDKVRVALVTGQVSVDKLGEDQQNIKMILNPGEEAGYSVKNKGFVKNNFDLDEILSWTEGVIYFRNAEETEVIEALERWYGVNIKLENESKKEWDYTASFTGQSLEHVLISIGYAMDFEFEIDKKSVVIKYK